MARMTWLDLEVHPENSRILDIGAVRQDGAVFHSPSVSGAMDFLEGSDYLCGHNIIRHDLKYLRAATDRPISGRAVDTLYLSPLLFPKKPYHALLKDDKLQVDELNNPVNDCRKAQQLFQDEVSVWRALPEEIRRVYRGILREREEFQGFFQWMGEEEANLSPSSVPTLARLIQKAWAGMICENARMDALIQRYPMELAYALALIHTRDAASVTPPWVLRNYPRTENVIRYLCGTPCREGCAYCRKALDIHRGLKRIFGYDSFRTYQGEPLQERAAQAAVDGKSLLAVFPTGGGKSITFQLPALLAGETVHGLTVVISPLQSLMKDQVDHLAEAGITEAVTLNGLLDPVERADAVRRVMNGSASLLFISPEQLRSKTIEKMLISRNVVRFVVDEAHCFSAWGQDFRVDYLYIGDFIRQLQERKLAAQPIPVSCFTATAKPKVISDIRDYFKDRLGLDLELFTTSAERDNLRYNVLFEETDEEKYNALRNLISGRDCPTIVYVSRTKRTHELARRLTEDGVSALPFNGKMEAADKIANQEAFLKNQVQVMVATSAFGMGVDKKDVGLVIHYDISDSLENYIQEAGRAGRDPSEKAECFVLFNNGDLDKHFILLNQTRLSIGEIQQVWKAIKDLTRGRPQVTCSPLEIARQAGWETSGQEMETRVKSAISALENAGYVRRGRNVPHVYASGIQAASMAEAGGRVRASSLFSEEQKMTALRILQFLISRRSIAKAGNDEAETRVDYLADILGLEKRDVVENIQLMRREGLLADTQDMSAWILKTDTENKSAQILKRFIALEDFLLLRMAGDGVRRLDLKKLNEEAAAQGLDASVRDLRTLLYFWSIKNWVRKEEDRERDVAEVVLTGEESAAWARFARRQDLARYAVESLYRKAQAQPGDGNEATLVNFSLVGLLREYETRNQRAGQMRMETNANPATLQDLQDALLYLSKIGAMRLEGGFLVLYNGMEIHRLQMDNRVRYKAEDYRMLDEFYRQKIQQIHIVGEYANMMVRNYQEALEFVRDYFRMPYRKFIAKYFKGERLAEISRNITPKKYQELFGSLSAVQERIIRDDASRVIVVAAGPGSGKTRVLVHKLASLLLLEDVKHEQLLMLTFSRSAATEFRKRLTALVGNAARYVEIKTFHSYCFDLLGREGTLEESGQVIGKAIAMIESGEVEPARIRKSVLVIDEAQDMDAQDAELVRLLIRNNEDMRVIAVGDDDQNIYEFRGSDAGYFRQLLEIPGAVQYEMTDNYRSAGAVVALENAFARTMTGRMKTTPLAAVREEAGKVDLIRETGAFFERAVAECVVKNWKGKSGGVLTSTNEEALRVYTLLKKAGVKAKLIQSLDGFRLSSLMELRYFLNKIDGDLQEPVISTALWEKAKKETEDRWKGSAAMEILRNLWKDFEASCPGRYRSDLKEFLLESSVDDFYDDDRETLMISTVHKAKGREFDQVWMMTRGRFALPEEKRRVYVGLTRARDELYLFCDTGGFDGMEAPGITHARDERIWEAPEEIMMQLTHRDVHLGYCRQKKEVISSLRAGLPLGIQFPYLTAKSQGRDVRVARLSKACEERIAALKGKGYQETGAEIRFIVAWKGEEDPEECWVILPNLTMRKGN